MQDYEVPLLLNELKYLDRNQWDQSRLHMATLVNMFSKEKKSIHDLMPMPWDEEGEEEHQIEMSNEDRARLQAKANKMAMTLKEI